MTCQHCQTWILDDDHRCRRCGRRVRNTRNRISPNSYPIAATATAPAYEADDDATPQLIASGLAPSEPQPEDTQQPLFSTARPDSRVIPFHSLTTQAERESIRARAADRARPAPLKSAKIEAPRARPRSTRSPDQRRLDFEGERAIVARPQSNIICDAPVAPARLRIEAAAIDASIIAIGCVFAMLPFLFAHIELLVDRHRLPFFALAVLPVPLLYKLLWSFAGRDTTGMRVAGLRLIDFDGNPPSRSSRYQRLLWSVLSFLAAGVGLIWAFVDEDGLTWHDHISGTFPTIVSKE
jgi:uncharacterized RDD family membrane protein YckC